MTGLGFITDTPRSGLPPETAPPLTALPTPPPAPPPRRSPPQRPEFKAPPEPADEFADLPQPVPPTAAEVAAEAAAMLRLRAQQKLEMDRKMTDSSEIYDLLMKQQAAIKAAAAADRAKRQKAEEAEEPADTAEDPPYERELSSPSDMSNPPDMTPEVAAQLAKDRAARHEEMAKKRRDTAIEEMRLIALREEEKQKHEDLLEAAREAAEKAAQEAEETRRNNQKNHNKTAAEQAAAAERARAAAEKLTAAAKAAAAEAEAERRRQAQLKAQRDRDLLSDDDVTDDDNPANEGTPPPLSDEDRANLARIEREEGRAQAFADMIDSISFTVEINHGLQTETCPYCQLNISALAYDEKKAHLLADLARETDDEPYPRADEMIHGPGALDLEYDDHAMRRWIYIDQRTHCQHCGIEFTEVGMRKLWFTGAERRAQLPDLQASVDLQHRNHRIRCPYQRRREGYDHLAQWGNVNPLDGRGFTTLPRRTRADLTHLYAQMDAMGDDTYALELIYNQVPRNLSIDADRTVITYPYNTELSNSQAQQYARAVRHVFCPSCRRRLRRRPYQIDGEERPAAETLEEHRAKCIQVPLPANFIGWISLELNQYLGKLRTAYPAKATLIAISEQVKWFHRWRLAANSTVPFTITGIGSPNIAAGWPPVPLPPCFTANAAVVLASTGALPVPPAVPPRPYRAHDGTTKDDQPPPEDEPKDEPEDEIEDEPKDEPQENKEKEKKEPREDDEDRSSSPAPASDDTDPEDEEEEEDDNENNEDEPEDENAEDDEEEEADDDEEEESDDPASEISEADEDEEDEGLLKRSDVLKGTARASRARRAGIAAQRIALQATRDANQANLDNLGAEALARAAKRAALDVVEGSTGLNAAQLKQAANLVASNARGAAAVAAITATIATNDAALLAFAAEIAGAEAEYAAIMLAIAAAVAAEKAGKSSKEDAMTDAEKAARTARRAARLERAQKRAAKLAERTAKQNAQAAEKAAKAKAKADGMSAAAKAQKAATKARQENKAKSRARRRARRALKLDAAAKAAKAIADEIARKAAERAAVPNPDPCPIIEFLCDRLARPTNPGSGLRFSSGFRKVTSRVTLDAPPGAWVSFMFPTYDNTDYAPAPMITPVTLAAFAGGNQPYQKYNMGINYFMRHLGFSVPKGAVSHTHTGPAKTFIAKGVAPRAPGFMSWLNPANINHNHITRMLTSLSILGRQTQAITLNAALVAAIGARAGPLAPAPAVLAAWAAAANLTPEAIAVMEEASIPLRLAQMAPPPPPPPADSGPPPPPPADSAPPPAPPAAAMRKHGILVYEGASYYTAKRRRLIPDVNPLLHLAVDSAPSKTLEADNIKLKALLARSKMKRYVSPHRVGRSGKRRKWYSGESVEPGNLLVTEAQGVVEDDDDDDDDHDQDQGQDESGTEDNESQSSQDLDQEENDVDDSSVEEEEDEETGDEGGDEEEEGGGGGGGEDDSEDGSGEAGITQEKPGEASESDENSEDEPELDESSAESVEGGTDTEKNERGNRGSPERLQSARYRDTGNYSPQKPRAKTPSEEQSGISVQSDADDSSDGGTASSSDVFLSVYRNPASVLFPTTPRVSGKSPLKPRLPLVRTDQNSPARTGTSTYTPQSRLLRISDPAFHLLHQS